MGGSEAIVVSSFLFKLCKFLKMWNCFCTGEQSKLVIQENLRKADMFLKEINKVFFNYFSSVHILAVLHCRFKIFMQHFWCTRHDNQPFVSFEFCLLLLFFCLFVFFWGGVLVENLGGGGWPETNKVVCIETRITISVLWLNLNDRIGSRKFVTNVWISHG